MDYQINLRTGKLSEKQVLQQDIFEAYGKAKSSNQFFELIKQKGHELYMRNGKLVGIQKNRRYRFKTLGYSQEKLQLLDANIEKDKRLEQIRKLRKNRLRDKDRRR